MRTTLFFLCLTFLLPTAGYSNVSDRELNDPVISKRIEQMNLDIVSARYDKIVRSYIRTYTILKRPKAERILGHQIMYFPIFEAYLDKYQLPDELKYLAVVESALVPKAKSSAGARGLWQFMPPTGEYFGLTINEHIDERCDPHAATEAAMKYLARLYERFNDWELAIAAYNSGGGRVSRAMKRARSTNFWQVKSYLPRETANYVPAFIAATYLMKYYEAHDLQPRYPSLDAQLTDRIRVLSRLTFYEIAQVTELPLNLIEQLNPAYEKLYIPARRGGLPLVLPRRVMPKLEAYLEELAKSEQVRKDIYHKPVFESVPQEELNQAYAALPYVLEPNQTIEQLAVTLGCTVQQLMAWNNLTPEKIRPGMTLKAFRPVKEKIERERAGFRGLNGLPTREVTQVDLTPQNIYEKKINRFLYQGEFLFYWVERRMMVGELARMLPGISTADILRFNDNIDSALTPLEPDDKVRIKKR